jgi:hypothetical protein
VRPILVDDVEGTVHSAYGRMPNMSWVLDRGGTILYKAEWTSAARVDDFLERRLAQRTGMTTPFHTEQLELRTVDRDAFYRGLQRNGPHAFTEFKRAEEIWAERARR